MVSEAKKRYEKEKKARKRAERRKADGKCYDIIAQADGTATVAAAMNIEQGTLLFDETPLLILDLTKSMTFDQATDQMTIDMLALGAEEQKLIFLMFENASPLSMPLPKSLEELQYDLRNDVEARRGLMALFAVYCLPSREGADTYRLFRDAAFLRHSCRPNAEAWYDETIGRLQVRASTNISVPDGTDVPVDSIIAISHIDVFQPREERHHLLGYTCVCKACDLHGPELNRSEARRSILRDGRAELDEWRKKHLLHYDGSGALFADEQKASLAATDPHTQQVFARADLMREVLEDEKLSGSAGAVVLEVVSAIHRAVASHTNNAACASHAIRIKGQQLSVLGCTLGEDHPRFQVALRQLQRLQAQRG